MKNAVLLPLGIGVIGVALGLVEVGIDPTRALFAYMAGFLVALTIALGSLLFVMIAHIARARWFVVLRRLTGAIAATIPVFPLLFLPMALGVKRLYPWAGPSAELDPEQRAWALHVHGWLNVPFFLVRSYLYLAIWSVVAIALRRASVINDEHPSEANVRRERFLAAAAVPVVAFTFTFASFDWVMSLNARWTSDMMGLYLFAGAFAGAVGATAIAAWLAWRAKLLPAEVGPAHFHALGRVLLVGVIFWAYIAFVQFLLVWIADLSRETSFYAERVRGGWAWVCALLGVVHFAVPFLLLLSRSLKRAPGRLAFAGSWLVCGHALDVSWLILPPLRSGMHGLDLAFVVGIGGLCAAFGAWRFFAAQSVPIHDPGLAESLRYESP